MFFCLSGFGQNPDYEWEDSESLGSANASNIDAIVIAVDTDSEDNIYALTFTGEVYKFDSEGNPDGTFDLEGSFEGLVDMAINSNDEIFVAHYEGREILAFDLSGNEFVNKRQETSYFKPLGIDFDTEDNLYVVEYNDGTGAESDESSRLKIYYRDGSTSPNNLLANRLVQPYRIAVAASGDFYISHVGEDDEGEVLFFDDEFNFIETLDDLGSPGSIEIDHDGFIYIIDYDDEVNFARILEQDLSYLLNSLGDIRNASNNGEFSIRIFDADNRYIEPIEDEIQLPIDLAFTYCTDKLAVVNSSITGSSIFTQLNFDLEIYNRTPSFDTEAPVAVCIDSGEEFTLQNGTITIDPDDIDNGSTDNCEIVDWEVSPSSFETPGDKDVTLTVTDATGNTDECTTSITIVEDEEEPTPPEAACNDITLELDENGEATLTAAEVYNGEEDYSLSIDQENFDCSDIGENTITLTVTDEENDLSDTCEAIITVEDNRSPEIECQGDITTSTEPGENFAVVTFSDPQFSDNCNSSIEQTEGLPSGSQFEVGTHTIEFTVTDSSDNTATCSFEITVEEEPEPSDPQFENCPGDITENNEPGECGAVVDFQVPTASDDSGELTPELISDLGPGDFFPVGTTEVIFEVTGESGETISCVFEVQVEDDEAPTITCPEEDMEIEIGISENSAIVEFDDPVVSDNCEEVEWEQTSGPVSGEYFTEGTTVVEFTATDAAGNAETCSFEVIVNRRDASQEPDYSCPSDEEIPDISFDENCEYEIPDFDYLIETENFTPRFEQIEEEFGSTLLVNIDIFDGEEKVGECSFSVSLVDETPPEISCPGNISEEIPEGSDSIQINYDEPEVSDNCDDELSLSRVSGPASGSEFEPGMYEITYEVSDDSGNTSSCSFNIMVSLEGQEELEFDCTDSEVVLDENGQASVNAEDFHVGQAQDWDFSLNQDSFDCSDLGMNTLTLTAMDPETGSMGSCELNLNVMDISAPIAECVEDFSVNLNSSGQAEISAEDLNFNSTDNCGIESLEIDQSLFTQDDLGENTVTLTVTDATGNSDSCEVTITVSDEPEETEIECTDEITASLDENGEVQLVLEDFYTGNANGLDLEASQLEFDCSDLGENTVVLSWSGEEEGSCEIPVIIEDDIEPVVEIENISLQLNEAGEAQITPEDVDAGSYDNCGTLNLSLAKTRFTCKDTGSNLVEFTATDAAGNSTSVNVEVFVNAGLGICSETGRDFDYLFIYPNPTNREFRIYTPAGIEVNQVIIFDNRGRLIAEKEFGNNEELRMQLEGVQNSVYTLQILTNEGEEIRRLIIRK